ncbi:hypothetical protein FFWV33_02310 [Flavobacterium faecale]|uniref:Uncharacterized protein n=1 Tax=Flavobacterium faecale TaxID=1355330 RepID=A0A2S1L9L6_9FLAO|nr:hypothetical protein [Flavobacterium faecale]AWG20443.1 hypothetical protein FFWV33_02310 [Flavobacterium faecale]
MTEYYILKLKNIDLQERVNRFPPDFKFNFDFAYLILHFVIEKMTNRMTKDKNTTLYNQFNSLSSKILESYCKDYRNHIRYLCENFDCVGNILERKNYTAGNSYSYRLRSYYQYIPIEAYEITNLSLLQKLKKQYGSNIQESVRKNYRVFIDYFNPKRLTVQLNDALNFNADLLEQKGEYANYLSNAFKILKIQNGQYYMTHNPETDGRFHSNITGFPKAFRKFLRYDSKKLAEVDICASVPTFLFYLLNHYQNLNSNLSKIIKSTKSYYLHYMFSKDAVSIDNKEIQDFGVKILNGSLYDEFKDDLNSFNCLTETYHEREFINYHFPEDENEKFREPKYYSRKTAKEQLLKMWNAKNNCFKWEQKAFKEKYPTILKFMQLFKSKNHCFFSYLVLQMESYFMLNIVARKLNSKYKRKIPFFTLHDCIITTVENIDVVKEFVLQTLTQELGFIPVVVVERYE